MNTTKIDFNSNVGELLILCERRKYVKMPNRPYVTAKYKEYFEKDQYTTLQCGTPMAYAGKTKSRF